MKQKRLYRLILLFIYFCIVAIITFGRHGYQTNNKILFWNYIKRNIQLVPGKTISEMIGIMFDRYVSTTVRVLSTLNIFGNIILFVPLGLFGGNKKFLKFIIGALLIVLLVEMIQLFTLRGAFDVDDVILNVTGAIIGYLFYNKCRGQTE